MAKWDLNKMDCTPKDRIKDLLKAEMAAAAKASLSTSSKIESDGLSTSYYVLPTHATELRHLISFKGMSKSRGDIFKACYRLGEKQGTDIAYDLNKMKFFIEDLIEMHQRGEPL